MSLAIPLHLSDQGCQGTIRVIDGDPRLKRKLMSLGLRAGQRIKVLQQRNNGVVVLSKGNRIALDASVASRVQVELEVEA